MSPTCDPTVIFLSTPTIKMNTKPIRIVNYELARLAWIISTLLLAWTCLAVFPISHTGSGVELGLPTASLSRGPWWLMPMTSLAGVLPVYPCFGIWMAYRNAGIHWSQFSNKWDNNCIDCSICPFGEVCSTVVACGEHVGRALCLGITP